ncbi:hypothetical protein DFH06DRAFT_1171808 [Mycena polygramma]|nr:hypothetical protein DFH06DRAFT_1171808 [Mycena polygramma]
MWLTSRHLKTPSRLQDLKPPQRLKPFSSSSLPQPILSPPFFLLNSSPCSPSSSPLSSSLFALVAVVIVLDAHLVAVLAILARRLSPSRPRWETVSSTSRFSTASRPIRHRQHDMYTRPSLSIPHSAAFFPRFRLVASYLSHCPPRCSRCPHRCSHRRSSLLAALRRTRCSHCTVP